MSIGELAESLCGWDKMMNILLLGSTSRAVFASYQDTVSRCIPILSKADGFLNLAIAGLKARIAFERCLSLDVRRHFYKPRQHCPDLTKDFSLAHDSEALGPFT
jgi:hypothetical protein